jgi:RNA polymerase sigma-70 factor, ECF subfamily
MLLAVRVTQELPTSESGSGPAMHEARLLAVARNQDRTAFAALFSHFGPRIKAVMLKAGADGAQAEDLVQDVMLAVWRKAGQYRPERGSVSAWIFTIARNARIDRLRRMSSQPYDDVDGLEIASDETGSDEQLMASEAAERVAEALDDLPKDQRQIVELAYLADKPQSEIARELAIPLGTVKSRLRLAYQKLRLTLEELR